MGVKFQFISFLITISVITVISSCNKSDGEKAERVITNYYEDPNTADKSKSIALDTALYNRLQMHLVHNKPSGKWPVKSAYPLPGAIIPFKRIVAYYGNFYTRNMGVLGQQPTSAMLLRLQQEASKWEQADPTVPVIAAIHYIAVTAQRRPGLNNKYRLRMPDHEIKKAIALAHSINAIVFLDVQVGHSTLQEELPALEPYLSMPNVHLGIDPEYSMKHGEVPCATIGTFDAADVNYASGYLSGLVRRYSLPPKILIVHRFTKDMLSNYKHVDIRPEVQIVINMDGFGFPAKKISSYNIAVANEPIQFTGFKLFYDNDKKTPPYRLMQPQEILNLYPSPIYIQYQ